MKMTLRMLVPVLLGLALLYTIIAWQQRSPFPGRETALIDYGDSILYVTVVTDAADSAILRTVSEDLTDRQLQSRQLRTLSEKMLRTVRSPQQDGVGIAAPQVGINRRVIAVQRFDKEGEPFEIYVNVHLDRLFGAVSHGQEGCLSVPPMRGGVPRHDSVLVRYTDPVTREERRETVGGYTAIIFQHECDHLDGILYIDRADSVFVSDAWVQERAPFEEKGAYTKPRKWK